MAGERAIPAADPIFGWADDVAVPRPWLELAWREFHRRHSEGNPDKRQRDWRQVFRNAVRGNWLRVWYFPDGGGDCRLTTAGEQLRREREAEVAEAKAMIGTGGGA